jgi:hypothetical protein
MDYDLLSKLPIPEILYPDNDTDNAPECQCATSDPSLPVYRDTHHRKPPKLKKLCNKIVKRATISAMEQATWKLLTPLYCKCFG